MNVLPYAICPLCSQVYPCQQLHSLISCEHPGVREKTIQVIRAYYAGWAAEHGACEPCWKSFRDAGGILSVLKQTRPQQAATG
jgi:hypothetical protein